MPLKSMELFSLIDTSPHLSKSSLINSIKESGLENFINTLPKGLDTRVGESGVSLSGGQIQRIAIARAFYREAKIIFLDEATNALDSITEKYILKSLEKMTDKCIFIISHNMRTLRHSSGVLLLKMGRLKFVKIPRDVKNKELFIKRLIKKI